MGPRETSMECMGREGREGRTDSPAAFFPSTDRGGGIETPKTEGTAGP